MNNYVKDGVQLILNEFTEQLINKKCIYCKYSIKVVDKKISNEPSKLICIRFPPNTQIIPKKKDKYLFPVKFDQLTLYPNLSIGSCACAEYEKEFNWQDHLNGKK